MIRQVLWGSTKVNEVSPSEQPLEQELRESWEFMTLLVLSKTLAFLQFLLLERVNLLVSPVFHFGQRSAPPGSGPPSADRQYDRC
jgi:hypothetical protein